MSAEYLSSATASLEKFTAVYHAVRQAAQDIEELVEHYQQQATTDPATQVSNLNAIDSGFYKIASALRVDDLIKIVEAGSAGCSWHASNIKRIANDKRRDQEAKAVTQRADALSQAQYDAETQALRQRLFGEADAARDRR